MSNASPFISVIISTLLLTSCISTGPKTPADFISLQSDKKISTAFSKYMGRDDDYYFRSKKNGFSLEKTHIGFTGSNINRSTAIQYIKNLKLDNDELARLYKEVLTSRNSYYTVYQGEMNKKIYEQISGGRLSSGNGSLERYYFDLTPAIIEYDENNRMKSVLLRSVTITIHPVDKVGPYAPVKIEVKTQFIDSNRIYAVESSINNNERSRYTLYSSKKENSQNQVIGSTTTAQTGPSRAVQIKELHALYKDGAITELEYKAEKHKILSADKATSAQLTNNTANNSENMSSTFMSTFQKKILDSYNHQHRTNFTSMQQIQKENSKQPQ